MNTKLTFVNRSTAARADVVLFQKQPCNSGRGQEQALVWKTIRHCAPGWSHGLTYSTDLVLAIGDLYGNYGATGRAGAPRLYDVVTNGLQRALMPQRAAAPPRSIMVRNGLGNEAVFPALFMRGVRVAAQPALAPGQQTSFTLTSMLWIAAGTGREGYPVDSALLSNATGVCLCGVRSADLVLRSEHPDHVTFTLENRVMA